MTHAPQGPGPSFLARFSHAVADAALVEDSGGARRDVAKLPAEVAHEDAHQVGIGTVAPALDPAQQRVVGHYSSGVEREDAQQLVLGGG